MKPSTTTLPASRFAPEIAAAHARLADQAQYDAEYRAAECILRSPLLEANPRVWRYVEEGGGIYFQDMLRGGHWSSAERLMLRAAWSLFNGDTEVNLGHLFGTLSSDNAGCVLAAMRVLADNMV